MFDNARLLKAARALTSDVGGVDWDAAAVQADVNALLASVQKASPSALASALDILVERLGRARIEDADGVAHVAISAGTLVELGAPPGPLAAVLVDKLPDILVAARRYADRCLADLPADKDDEDVEPIVEVDNRPIPIDVFRAHLSADRPGASALHRLREWVLPAVASLTRDRAALRLACADPELRQRAAALRDSEAHWLDILLGVELDATWLVLCPLVERGFRLSIDGVATNFVLHTLVAEALTARGIAGARPPAQLVAFLEGRADKPRVNYVEGIWNFYSWRAAAEDLKAPHDVPHALWIWNEGEPRDVPTFEGTRTLLVGPPAVKRTWSASRPFAALSSRVSVEHELDPEEVRGLIARMKESANLAP